MFLQDTLFICVLLHLSPNFYRCVESALVIKPQNVAAKSGEFITVSCSTDAGSKGKIEWSAFNRESSRKETIYDGQASAPKFSSYISVSDRDDGMCSLNITASVTAAKRYMCTDRLTGESAIAELILLEKNTACSSENNAVHVSCSLAYAGNWAPVVECKQWNKSRIADLPGNLINTSVDNVVTLTWNYISDNEEFQIFCVTAFKESERPKETSATNVPKYFDEIVMAYIGKPACSKYECIGWIVAFGVLIAVSAALAIKLVADCRRGIAGYESLSQGSQTESDQWSGRATDGGRSTVSGLTESTRSGSYDSDPPNSPRTDIGEREMEASF